MQYMYYVYIHIYISMYVFIYIYICILKSSFYRKNTGKFSSCKLLYNKSKDNSLRVSLSTDSQLRYDLYLRGGRKEGLTNVVADGLYGLYTKQQTMASCSVELSLYFNINNS